MSDASRFLYDDQALLIVARRIRDDRAAADPGAVIKNKLTEAAALDRATCSAALVAMWQHVVDRTPFDTVDPFTSLGASWAQLRGDLDAALIGAQARAAAKPDDAERRDIADCIASMRLHLTPVTSADTPNVAFCHAFNLCYRARRWPERAAA